MGDAADLAREYYEMEMYESQFNNYPRRFKELANQYKTENVLNRNTWYDAYGNVHELKEMDKDYLQNILFFIYKRRDRYWLNCNDTSVIEKFQNGDEFFQHVIRKSTIWRAIIAELEKPTEGFNFEFTIPGT